MPMSKYIRKMREHLGHDLLLMPGVAALIKDERGRTLLQLRSDNGEWGLPAGAIDPGETPAKAIKREVYEETGLHVIPRRVVGVFGGPALRVVYANGDQTEYTVVLFACDVRGGTLRPVDGESLRLEYVEPHEAACRIPRYPAHIFTRDTAAAYFED